MSEMARATSAPVPVMATTDEGTAAANDSGSSTRKAAGAAAAAAGKTAAATGGTAAALRGAGSTPATSAAGTHPYLGGPWGASFIGKTPTGKDVKGLTWTRKHTRPDIHPYDEIEWEL